MESYILKFYRCEHGDREQFSGLLECALSGEKAVFQSFEELHDLLLGGFWRGRGKTRGKVANR